ncbi:laccase domain protein [Alicyclobacillus contaminans]|nr:peptidoglycan editing factor PgeF [Alicyclobacillus contaminans]GMA49150.1 laccase domain protein [Alicyclobacillus contaminans]
MIANWQGSPNHPRFISTRWPWHDVRGLFSLRAGGVSEPPYETLNVGLHVGDRPHAVLQNRSRVAAWVGCGPETWVVPEQVHGNRVAVVDASFAGRGALAVETAVPDVDALVTAEPELPLAVFAADCVPMLFFDPVRRVVAAAHSGWKGTVGHIAREVLSCMREAFDCSPADVRVALGPSIRRCCYEVDESVATMVRAEFGARTMVSRFGRPGKFLLSLQACIRMDLIAGGVLPDHIEDTGACTSCQADLLFSHRAHRGRTGRQLGIVCLSGGDGVKGQELGRA